MICLKLKAKKFIFGEQGQSYCDKESFKVNSIDISFQKYNHPTYKQRSKKFIENISIIDLLFNEGKDSKNILMQNNEKYNPWEKLYKNSKHIMYGHGMMLLK